MDPELLYSLFYQAIRDRKYLEAKNTIYEAHRQGMPAGHILVKLVNRTLDQLQRDILATTASIVQVDFSSESRKYFEYLTAGDRAGIRKLVDNLLKNEVPPSDILLKVITPAMDDIGTLQSRQEISLSQIYMAAKITEESLARLLPLMPAKPKGLGKIIIGNAFGDYHALGRKIVATFLRFYGFDVVDLGESVPNEKFVEQVVQENASVIFVSALLIHTAKQIQGLRQLLREKNLQHVKIVAGGAPFNFDRQFYKELGCDAMAPNGLAAVQVAKSLVQVA
jgi:5-methyltetrahydrofolate--homocysteine methyltransferase